MRVGGERIRPASGFFFAPTRTRHLLFLPGALRSRSSTLLIFIITKLTPFLCWLKRARPKSVKGIKSGIVLCCSVCVCARAPALEVRDEFFHKRLTPSFCQRRVERAGCLFLKKLRDFSPPAGCSPARTLAKLKNYFCSAGEAHCVEFLGATCTQVKRLLRK